MNRADAEVFLILTAVAGWRTSGSSPHDMSEAGHEAAAKEAERKYAEHAATYDPAARAES